MSLKTVENATLVGMLLAGLGAIILLVWMNLRMVHHEPPASKMQHEDDLSNGTRCYWLYTGESGGIAMSCVPLADGGR